MRRLVALLWLALTFLMTSGPALAHAALVESHPTDGAIIEQAPRIMRLRFNEPVSALVIRLTDAQGGSHPGLAVITRNETLEIALPEDLPRGSHLLSYRVTSGDGHPVGGSIAFSVGVPTGSLTAPDTARDRSVPVALWTARMALYLGLFVGAGGAFFTTWIAPKLVTTGTIRFLKTVLVVGVGAAVLSVGLQGLDARGTSLAGLVEPATWAAGWRTSFGLTAAMSALALLLALISLRGGRELFGRRYSLAALACAGTALALSGHAGAASPQWLTRPAVFLHGVGVAYWIGALAPLATIVWRGPTQALPAIRRFSNGALVAVAVLTLAGLFLAVVQIENPANLMQTAYGQVLIVKTMLVVALLALAALNRLWLTPALATARGSGSRWLVGSVVTEIALAVAILGIAGLWRFTPPPRALAPAAEAAASVSVHLHSPRIMAQVTLSPGRFGAAKAKLVIASGQAEPMEPKEVRLILAKPDAGIEPLERRARKTGAAWLVEDLALPASGPWQVKVDILVNDFEKTSLEGSIVLPPGPR